MPDFWRHSGYHLLDRGDDGRLVVTDAFLCAYFRRPEVRPVEESCDAERALHAALIEDPRQDVPEARLAALADPDAQDNYRTVLRFRRRLLETASIEDCYLSYFLSDRPVDVPPLFLDQLVQVILRNLLEGVEDGLRPRAAEIFYRPQQVMINDGAVMVADQEIVDMYAESGGFGDLGRLIVEAQTPVKSVELDVLSNNTAVNYFERDERHDTVLDFSFTGGGLDAFCRVLEAWVAHLLNIGVSIQPVQKIADQRWVWHTGLDGDSSQILNDLYNGVDVESERIGRILSLFRLEFDDPSVMRPDIAGRAVYLAVAKDKRNELRLKPQNLLVNLPLAARA